MRGIHAGRYEEGEVTAYLREMTDEEKQLERERDVAHVRTERGEGNERKRDEREGDEQKGDERRGRDG